MLVLKVIIESIAQAFSQLTANKLRAFLSLLGITIGIWCVISVLSAVESLEMNIRGSINKLGDDIVYIDKFSWAEDPSSNYWKWRRRPDPSYKDFKAIASKIQSAKLSSYAAVIGLKSVEFKSINVSNVPIFAMTYDYAEMFNFEFSQGRYFNNLEYHSGTNQVILGNDLATQIFGENINPIGKRIKFMGVKMTVLGVLKKEGESLLQILDFDEVLLMGFNTARKIANVENVPRAFINVKAKDDVTLEQLEDEITGVLRAHRRLKPKEESNFALNKLSIVAQAFDQVFSVIGMAGWFIGLFSILVGGFGVANIMFVSVKERTSLIGIKKALGAKRYIILLEFLIEAIILCVLGGAIGLLLVFLMTKAATAAFDDFEFVLSQSNITLGLSISIIIGIIAGFLPAFKAAKMDPVEAIRS